MRRWVDRNWYRYLAYRLGPDGLFAASVVTLAVVGVCGALTMRALASGGHSNASASYVPMETTVLRRVAVVERGKTVYKRVPIVKRIYAKPVTVQETRVVQTPSGTKVVTEPVVRFRPVYRRQVVLVHGKPVVVNRVVTDTQMLTNTQMLTVTNDRTSTVVNEHTNTVVNQQTVNQTVTNVRTETDVRTETLPPETVTVTGPTQTAVVTTTVESPVTVTVPVTVPVTVTVGGG